MAILPEALLRMCLYRSDWRNLLWDGALSFVVDDLTEIHVCDSTSSSKPKRALPQATDNSISASKGRSSDSSYTPFLPALPNPSVYRCWRKRS